MDTAHPQLLARDAAIESARVLEPQFRALENMVDYGTNLIMRVLNLKDDRRITDFVLVAVLCKQVVTMLDGVVVLMRSGCAIAANVTARSLWEADLQMAWVLMEDTERRARAFWVAHLVHELRRCESDLPGSEYRNRIGASAEGWPPEAEVRKEMAQIQSALGQPECSQFLTEQKTARFWAAPVGASSRKKMAEQLGRWQEYEVLYALLSGSAHGEAPVWHLRARDGVMHLRFIRDPRQSEQTVGLVAIWTVRCYQAILSKYRPDELENFIRHYAEHWRPAIRGLRQPPT